MEHWEELTPTERNLLAAFDGESLMADLDGAQVPSGWSQA